MRNYKIFLVALAIGVGAAACKKQEKDPSSTGSGSSSSMMGSGSAAAAGSGSGSGSDMGAAAAGSGSDTGAAAATEPEMVKKAGNCPSTVFGAITKAEVKGKDVVLTITSENKDAVAAIQKRTELLLKDKHGSTAGAAHDAKGTHGGGIGLCPVFYGEGGTAKSKKDAKGVTIVITPKKEKPEDLKAKIDDRISKTSEWVGKNIKPGDQGNTGGVGGGKGLHGSRHQGAGDSKGKERKGGGGAGTGGGDKKKGG